MKSIAYALITCTALFIACFAPDIADRRAGVVFASVFSVATLFATDQKKGQP